MSEALERVRGVRELPLFPLPLVLFPGVPQALHIFEPRYRRMLADVRAGNNLFGLSYFDSDAAETHDDDAARPPIGHVGCATEVVEAQTMPDGRSNIITFGLARYRVESYVESDAPYLIGRVEFFEDEEEDAEELTQSAREVSALFTRIARAVREINGERGRLPELPEDEPESLSFLVAAAMEIGAEARQSMLELRSTSERLRLLYNLLTQSIESYENRARIHE
ncbi:MAG: LON peptidase substrate-binding domain-containing protein, partial [Pyrinomonadaceae bacterium]